MKRARFVIALCAGLALASRSTAAGPAPAAQATNSAAPAAPQTQSSGQPAPAVNASSDEAWSTWATGGNRSIIDDVMIDGTIGQTTAGMSHVFASLDCGDWDVQLTSGFWAPYEVDGGSSAIVQLPGLNAASNVPALDGSSRGVSTDAPVLEFALAPVTPNPSPGAVLIQWAVPRATRVKLSILDVQGRQVADLAAGVYSPGRYSVKWNDRRGTPPGLYFARFEHERGVIIRRVVLVP